MEASGFVTRTSQNRFLFGPPDLASTLTSIKFALHEIAAADGTGPDSFSNVTLAPSAKPTPEIVMDSIVPDAITPSLIDWTLTPSGVGVDVGVGGNGVAVGVGVTVGVGVCAGAGITIAVAVGAGANVGVAVGGTDVLVGSGVAMGFGVDRRRGVLVGVGVFIVASMTVGEGPISGVFASTALNTEICAPTKTTANPPSSVPMTTDTVKKPGAS